MDQPQAEFGRRRWLQAPLGQPDPQTGEHRREDHDVDRIDRLEERRGNAGAVDEIVGEQVERPARLLEQAPEQRLQRDQEEDREDPVTGLALEPEGLDQHEEEEQRTGAEQDPANEVLILDQDPDHPDRKEAHSIKQPFQPDAGDRCREARGIGRFAPAEQQGSERDKHQQARDHADAGEPEAVLPAHRLAEISDQDRADRRADVNPHVEDGVGAVAADVGARIELPHDHRDVGFEEARADDDECEREPEDVDRRIFCPPIPSTAIRPWPIASMMPPNRTALRCPR